jgi:dihydroflavonol-4-reductase
MRVLVTGSNGHLGSNLCRSLRREGHEVRAMVRAGSDLRGLQRVDVQQVVADVRDAEAVDAATRGCDAVVHLAAVYDTSARADRAIAEVADVGTRHVLQAAARHGVSRVLYASSMVAVGFAHRPDAPRHAGQFHDDAVHPYFRAKTAAERLAWREAERLGVPLVSLLPGGLLGPHDHRLTPTTRFVRDLLTGDAQTVPGGANYVDVRDVADAFTAALTDGRPGQRYLLTGDLVLLRDLGRILYSLTGRRCTHVPLPRSVLLGSVRAAAAVARWRGRPPEIDPRMAAESIDRYPAFCREPARRDLGFHPRPPTPVLADTVRWLARIGALPQPLVDRLWGRVDPSALAVG